MFEIIGTDLSARVGRLKTPHGEITTPALLPVIQPVSQSISLDAISNLGFQGVMTNAYITLRRKKDEAEKKGIHKIINFNGPIMKDSGGYQILEFGQVNTNLEQMALFQQKIKSDICVILDKPTGYKSSREFAVNNVKDTLIAAKKTLNIIEKTDSLWTGVVQGGLHLDLLAKCAQKMSKMPFDVYALGSPTGLMENYGFAQLGKMIIETKKNIPINKPLHLFGAGHPLTIPLAVSLGCDLFDSASYVLFARRNKYMTENGTVNLTRLKTLPCLCSMCTKYSLKEIKEADSLEREKILGLHNLYVLQKEIMMVREAILEGRLWEYTLSKSRLHPNLWGSNILFKEENEFFNDGTPLFKQKAIFITDHPDQHRPEIARHVNTIINNIKLDSKIKIIVIIPFIKNEFLFDSEFITQIERSVKKKLDIIQFFVMKPPYGIVPLEISDIYPTSQTVLSDNDEFTDNITIDNIKKIIFQFNIKNIIFIHPKGWNPRFLKIISKHNDIKIIKINTEKKESERFEAFQNYIKNID